MGIVAMKWLLSSIVVFITVVATQLQLEINDLKAQLRKMGTLDSKAAAAIKQFETDLFAKVGADEKTRLAKEAMEQAQRNAALQQGLNWLPTKDMDKPVLWGQEPNKKSSQ
jgi:hypothetical protein